MADRKKICHIRSTAYAYYLYGNSIPNGETFKEASTNPTTLNSINDNSPKWYRYNGQYYLKEGKQPRADILNFGEFAINYKVNNEQVYFKNNEEKIVSFSPTTNLKAQGIVVTDAQKGLQTSLFGNSKGKAVFVNSNGTSLEYKSLGSAAFTSSSSYATSGHNHDDVYSKLGHTHLYAGSASAGGAATSANKINTDGGSSIKPVYFSNGIPKECGFTVLTSVPKDAVFTDHTYTLGSFGITASSTELNYTKGVTSNIQTQLNNKSDKGHTHNYLPLTGGTLSGDLFMMKSDPHNTDQFISFKYSSKDLDNYSWRLGYLGTGTGNENAFVIQNNSSGKWEDVMHLTLDKKDATFANTVLAPTFIEGGVSLSNKYAPKSHDHYYAGSTSIGGAAKSATKLNTDGGSSIKPVYFSNGVPVACGFTVETSVPKNAKFSDTIYSLPIAATDKLGGVMIGKGINIDSSNGAISATYTSVGAAASSHTHPISQITDLQSKLDGKSNTGHTHTTNEITDLQGKLNSKLNVSLKGAKSGLAELDANGKVPASQLPSYVDDVIEGYEKGGVFYSDQDHAHKITPESGKIYVDLDTNKTYRWSGTAYVVISETLALGTTSSTAYYGDKGNAAYQHSLKTSGNPHKVTKTDVGLSNVENKSSATIRGELTSANIQKALGYIPPSTDTTYSIGGDGTNTVKLYKNGGSTAQNSVTINNVAHATDANKLIDSVDKGSSNQPVYFLNGLPVACGFTIGKTVPSDAKFTDTTYSLSGSNATVTLTPSSGTATTITINNVSHAGSADSATSAGKCTGNSATATTASKIGAYTPSDLIKWWGNQSDIDKSIQAGIYTCQSSTHAPLTYGTYITLPYRTNDKNSTVDYANQLFIGTGDQKGKDFIYYRTSGGSAFGKWRTVLDETNFNTYAAAKTHSHTKSQITDFPSKMPASDVYAWAKEPNKPSYTYTEVGAASASHNHDTVYSKLNHDHDSRYVNVTGDTMTGDLNIHKSNSVLKLSSETANRDFSSVSAIDASNSEETRDLILQPKGGNVGIGIITPKTLLDVNGIASATEFIEGGSSLSKKYAPVHSHPYAGSSSQGGAATSANKLNTNGGSSIKPVYFSGGVPVACSYTLEQSVTSTSKLTDTTYSLSGGNGTANVTLTPTGGTATTIIINNVSHAGSADSATSASKCTGNSATASKLNTDGGSSIKPVYFSGGVPKECDFTVETSVPKNAVFTDTTYSLSSFGISATSTEINKLDGATVSTTEINRLSGVTSNIQTQLNNKSDKGHTHNYLPLTGGTLSGDLAMMRANQHNTDQFISFKYSKDPIDKFSWRLGYLGTGTGEENAFVIQNDYRGSWEDVMHLTLGKKDARFANTVSAAGFIENGKSLSQIYSAIHSHPYAGSSSQGGAATSANKINTDGGSATKPVYFSGGVPVACTYTLGQSVTSSSKLTDTTYTLSGSNATVTLTPSSGTAKSITIDNVAHATSASGCTGNSASASKLNTDGGSSIKPVYFSGGVPKECGFTVETSVPKNAVFTDTVYTLPIATSDKLGGVKIGSGININSGVISATYTSVGAAPASHTHPISQITDLQSKLDGKSNTGHGHKISEITSLQGTLDNKLEVKLKGVANGLAELDANGKVPSSQLPSYVDDVIEGYEKGGVFYIDQDHAHKITPESGKVYVDIDSNRTYRWSGTQYTLIASDLALGTTSTTAYRGDLGNIAYKHSQIVTGNPHKVTKTDVGLGNVENLTAAQINAKITKSNVTTALGYTPSSTNTTYKIDGDGTNTVKLYANGSSTAQNSVTINNVSHADTARSATTAGSCTGNAATASKLVSSVDVGSTSQPVYFVDGLPKTCGFTVLTSVPKDAVFTDTKYSLGSFGITATASEINVLDGITATTAELNKLDGLTATTAELNYVDGVTSNIQTQLNGKSNSHTHPYLPLKGGTLTGLLTASGGIALDATTTSISKPQFLVSMDSFADGGKLHWTQSSDVTVGSATNATKLTTARTLWGQSFNGTANISGSLSNTGNITPSADLTYTLGTASLMYTKTFTRYIDTKSGYDLRLCAGGSEKLHIVAANGNVGIGNENPTEKLDVTGTAKAEKVNIKSKVTMEYNSTEECLEFVFV